MRVALRGIPVLVAPWIAAACRARWPEDPGGLQARDGAVAPRSIRNRRAMRGAISCTIFLVCSWPARGKHPPRRAGSAIFIMCLAQVQFHYRCGIAGPWRAAGMEGAGHCASPRDSSAPSRLPDMAALGAGDASDGIAFLALPRQIGQAGREEQIEAIDEAINKIEAVSPNDMQPLILKCLLHETRETGGGQPRDARNGRAMQ